MSVTFGDGPFVDGQEYLGSDGTTYCYLSGCFSIPAPEDVDTVDGYSLPGVAGEGLTDMATGDPIAEGSRISIYYGPDGEILGYKDCSDMTRIEYVAFDPAVHTPGATPAAGDDDEPFQIPLPVVALDKDGNPITDPYTPVDAGSLEAAGRVADADLGDMLIGVNSDGDCVLFDPVVVPEVIQIGGDIPPADSPVQIWIDNGTIKYTTDAGWVQGNPYGAKA